MTSARRARPSNTATDQSAISVGDGGRGENQGAPRAHEVRAVAETRTNSVLVTAHENDMKLVDQIVEELDRQVTDAVRIVVYPLRNAEAADMAKVLQDLFRVQVQATRQAGGSRGSRGSRGSSGGSNPWTRMSGRGGGQSSSKLPPAQEMEITPDTRTNSVIIKAAAQYHDVIRELVEDLDANPTEATTTYYIPLRNATATDLASTLRNLLRGSGGRSGQTNQGAGTPFGIQRSNRQAGDTRNRNRSSSGGGRRNQRLGPLQDAHQDPFDPFQEEEPRRGVEGQFDVEADAGMNALIVRTSPRNFEAIQRLIADADRPRPQVLIKVLIAEVTLTDELKFGVEGFWENKMTVPGGDKGTNRFDTDMAVGTEGLTYLLSGDEFQATLNMFAKDGRLEVLATPRILVLDNQTASIDVGKEVPIVTSSQVTQQGNTINSIQYERVGILLEVTPHINPDGIVTMAIRPEISDVASEAESVQISEGTTSPTFIVNSADTTVAVRNGMTVVIGGLIRETTDDTVEKVPILGDIPILGWLFTNKVQKKVKRELMIFLTPYVAFTVDELEELSELEKAKLKLIDERTIESEGDLWLDRIKDHIR